MPGIVVQRLNALNDRLVTGIVGRSRITVERCAVKEIVTAAAEREECRSGGLQHEYINLFHIFRYFNDTWMMF